MKTTKSPVKCLYTYLQFFPYGQFPFWAQCLQKLSLLLWLVPLEVVAFVPKRSNTLGLLCESLFLFTVVSTVIFLFVCFDMFSGIVALNKIRLTFTTNLHLKIYTAWNR
jgi:hypothetical protein